MDVDELKVSSSTQARASLITESDRHQVCSPVLFIKPIWTTHELCPTNTTDKLMILSGRHGIGRYITSIQY
jgi:hypothetical protein